MTTSLTNRAMLVSVNVRQWNGRRLDKSETEAVVTRHNAVRGAARVNKDLLPTAVALQKVQKQAGEIRTYVYKHTLPWADGVRILRAEGYLDFMQGLQRLRIEWDRLVAGFLSEYPQLKADASITLGTLFDDNDYPDEYTLKERFAIETRFMPVPDAADWRVDLGDDEIAHLKENVERQVRESQQQAMKEVYDRIFDVAAKAHERLANPKAIFRDSLVENAVELCRILPSLNLTGDKKVDELAKKIMSSLGKYSPATLRKDTHARKKTADAMKDVMSKMTAMYGA